MRDRILDRIDVYCMNEDEMQSYLGRTVDLLDADDVEKALGELHAAIPAGDARGAHEVLVARLGASARGSCGEALQGGITMASTRYCYGDGFTVADYEAVGRLAVHEGGVAVGEDARGGWRVTVAVPASCSTFNADDDRPRRHLRRRIHRGVGEGSGSCLKRHHAERRRAKDRPTSGLRCQYSSRGMQLSIRRTWLQSDLCCLRGLTRRGRAGASSMSSARHGCTRPPSGEWPKVVALTGCHLRLAWRISPGPDGNRCPGSARQTLLSKRGRARRA